DQRVTELERRVASLETALAQTQGSSEALTKTITTEGACPIQLASWSYRVIRGDHRSDQYEITLDLKNSGSKDIKLIDGGVAFKDLLGETIYSIRLTLDQKVAAGKNVIDKDSYRINRFISSEGRMAQMKKEDIQAIPVARKLVFADNTISKYN